jgi:hypothetical protein
MSQKCLLQIEVRLQCAFSVLPRSLVTSRCVPTNKREPC